MSGAARPAPTPEELAQARERITKATIFYARQVHTTVALDPGMVDLVRRNIAGMASCWDRVSARRHDDEELPDVEAMTPRQLAAWRMDFGQVAFLHAVYDGLGVIPMPEIDRAFARLKQALAALQAEPAGSLPQ